MTTLDRYANWCLVGAAALALIAAGARLGATATPPDQLYGPKPPTPAKVYPTGTFQVSCAGAGNAGWITFRCVRVNTTTGETVRLD